MTPTTLLVISFLVCKNPASLCFDLCRNRLHRVSDHWPHVVIPLFFISYRTNSSFSAKALGEPPPLSGRFCFSASPPFQWHTGDALEKGDTVIVYTNGKTGGNEKNVAVVITKEAE